ncbi:PhoH family protein [Demequina sp. SYSU T00039]|uniref:PhoH family protein n=1 Tax=Demequina lignilytica TaxID=3051663 RepID=A0AAW7M1K1_9MICO|nr:MULTISPECIES: AAA family ATPase [unclassified Demequina]MDN4477131.1 PhoH family protein [Demequina sp. SYSU T00039-1]MDN4487304.1 PhoH family protein [Demequina sp. SYSU T00039]MDN4491555.1 PhoH family protein [Demequina sp. SYSU T00068]
MSNERGLTAERGGLTAEQEVVDGLYSRLDDLRGEAEQRLAAIRREGPSGSPQNRSERDAFATLYEDRIAQLDAVEDRLCFGRLDLRDGEHFYVGRIGLSDAEHVPLLTDWRAPAARAFYSATAANPGPVVNRRHLTTSGRRVTAVEDDVLDVDALREMGADTALAGEGALLAALGARRTGRMGDIVATIQAEQDAVIRAPMTGALVVQGGPGSGKTAVALHRAAYLLYHHREQLESKGVLLIGPSRTFLRYIDHVLPSLGETGAVSTTLAGLVPGVDASAVEDDRVAQIKGRTEMAAVVAAAVKERQRLPRADRTIRIDGRTVTIRRSDIRDAQAKARRDGRPHNEARAVFAKEMITRLTRQLMEQLDHTFGDEDRIELERDVRDDRNIRIAINLCWLPVTPEQLLRDLYSKPHLLDHAARGLTPDERDLLLRPPHAPFTDADVPLLDEAAELLGEMPGGRRRRSDEPSAEEIQYAKDVLDTFGDGGMVTAESLAARMKGGTARLSVAERARGDRTWTYGHVVVDEAQELSPMAWRMLLRRCPTRSFTIVGDVAQTTASAGTRWWPETMDPLFQSSWELRELTISYRIPAAVAAAAQGFAKRAGLPVSELSAARELDDAVGITSLRRTDDAVSAAAGLAREHAEGFADAAGGLVAVIAPERLVAATRAAVAGTEIEVCTARESKGLEFDVAVVVEPAAIAVRPGDLYVALTRPTRRLEVVHAEPLPPGLAG